MSGSAIGAARGCADKNFPLVATADGADDVYADLEFGSVDLVLSCAS